MGFNQSLDSNKISTAWVYFDGAQSPPTIIKSLNVSDVIKNNVGDYTIVFSTPMANTDYTFAGTYTNPASGYADPTIRAVNEINDTPRSINSIRVSTRYVNASANGKESFGTGIIFFGGV